MVGREKGAVMTSRLAPRKLSRILMLIGCISQWYFSDLRKFYSLRSTLYSCTENSTLKSGPPCIDCCIYYLQPQRYS